VTIKSEASVDEEFLLEKLQKQAEKKVDTKRRRCRIRASLEGTQARSLTINQAIRVGAGRYGFTRSI